MSWDALQYTHIIICGFIVFVRSLSIYLRGTSDTGGRYVNKHCLHCIMALLTVNLQEFEFQNWNLCCMPAMTNWETVMPCWKWTWKPMQLLMYRRWYDTQTHTHIPSKHIKMCSSTQKNRNSQKFHVPQYFTNGLSVCTIWINAYFTRYILISVFVLYYIYVENVHVQCKRI